MGLLRYPTWIPPPLNFTSSCRRHVTSALLPLSSKKRCGVMASQILRRSADLIVRNPKSHERTAEKTCWSGWRMRGFVCLRTRLARHHSSRTFGTKRMLTKLTSPSREYPTVESLATRVIGDLRADSSGWWHLE